MEEYRPNGMTEQQAERIANAFESIANTFKQWYNSEHPAKPAPKDAIVTYVKGEEEALLEDQGATGEQTTEEWTDLGAREQDFLERERFKYERNKK